MKRLLILAFVLIAAPAVAQFQSSGVGVGVQAPIFGLPAINGSAITPATVGVNASTCAAPGIYLTSAPTTGMAFTATPSVILCVNGTAILTSTSSAVTSSVPIVAPDGSVGQGAGAFNTGVMGIYQRSAGVLGITGSGTLRYSLSSNDFEFFSDTARFLLGASGDVSLSRGAANRLDLATGDSLYLVSGGLGVGAVNTNAGTITATGQISSDSNVSAGAGAFTGWATRSLSASSANGKITHSTNNTTSGIYSLQFTDNPTCATNCGTSPTLTGVDSSFTLTMGASGVPASGFVVTFNGTWAAAPQCVGSMAKAGMVVGKLPLTLVTDTTTLTVVTNGTAPATTDMYHFKCSLGQ